MSSTLPHPRRIVASNLPIQSSGTETLTEPAVEILDETIAPTPIFGGVMERTSILTNATVPTSNDGFGPVNLDEVPGVGIVLPGGANVYFLDLAPNYVSPMHRTVSTDYVIVMEGTPTYTSPPVAFDVTEGRGNYEKTQETLCKRGDVVVQRGSMHAWANHTNEWARLLCVVLAANPTQVKVGEDKVTEPLGEAWLS